MNYPLITEYIDAIRSAEDNFDKLTNLRPVLNNDNLPIMSSGNFAVVFKMQDITTKKLYAVKCFTKEQEDREDAYEKITEGLKDNNSSYLVSIRYYKNELFVDTNNSTDTEFPVLLMDWVEGDTLDKYIENNLESKYNLDCLCYEFTQMSSWLLSQPFAHGDLKPDNILVKEDGRLTLVDYDGMYFSGLEFKKVKDLDNPDIIHHVRIEQIELGSPDYRHPKRKENREFDLSIDDFPIASILLSLKIISLDTNSLSVYGVSGRLLFSEADYLDLSSSKVFSYIATLFSDYELCRLYSAFVMVYSGNKITKEAKHLILKNDFLKKYASNTEVFNEDIVSDDYGGQYSSDGRFFVKYKGKNDYYKIKERTIAICENIFHKDWDSFDQKWNINEYRFNTLRLPSSLQYISPTSLIIEKIKIENYSPCFLIENNALYSIDKSSLIYCFNLCPDKEFFIPNTVKCIYESAFRDNTQIIRLEHQVEELCINKRQYCIIPESLNDFYYNNNVKSRNDIYNQFYNTDLLLDEDYVLYTFDKKKLIEYPFWCKLNSYKLLDECKEVCNDAFNYETDVDGDGLIWIVGNSLYELFLNNGLEIIGIGALNGCSNLKNLTIPSSVKTVKSHAFASCENLKIIRFSDSVDKLEYNIFGHPNDGNSYFLPTEKTYTRDFRIEVPLGDLANFKNSLSICSNKIIEFSETTYSRLEESIGVLDKYRVLYSADGRKLLKGNNELSFYNVREGTIAICDNAFRNFEKLKQVELPESITYIGEYAFKNTKITQIKIPDNVEELNKGVFYRCYALKEVVIHPKLLTIPELCFSMCYSLNKIDLKHIRNIKEAAFSGCKSISILSFSDYLIDIKEYAFKWCDNLRIVYFQHPYSTPDIDNSAFDECSNLHQIIIYWNSNGIREQFDEKLAPFKNIIMATIEVEEYERSKFNFETILDAKVANSPYYLYEKAISLYNKGAIKDAIPVLKLAAKEKHMLASRKLAKCYNEGIGVEQNDEKAFKYYSIAAIQGDQLSFDILTNIYNNNKFPPSLIYYLADVYEKNNNYFRNRIISSQLYQESAELGYGKHNSL